MFILKKLKKDVIVVERTSKEEIETKGREWLVSRR